MASNIVLIKKDIFLLLPLYPLQGEPLSMRWRGEIGGEVIGLLTPHYW